MESIQMRFGYAVIGAVCLVAASSQALAQTAPRMDAVSTRIDIRNGDTLRPGAWVLDASANPDIHAVELGPEERRTVCFESGPNKICRDVQTGDQFDFVIAHGGVDYPTRITTRPARAVFNAAYRAANQGRIQVLAPEAYELVNVAIALTPKGRQDPFLVHKQGAYYEDLITHFEGLSGHPLITAFAADMAKEEFGYFRLKMNAYAVEFNEAGRLVPSTVYNRIYTGPDNDLIPYLPLLQDFADKSDFRAFYRRHADHYADQISYYRDEIDVPGALAWLQTNFPEVRSYDSVKIIFSPLVANSQSLVTFESNGFTELQPHVNFPYPRAEDEGLAPKSVALQRGSILFTEMNHGFIAAPGASRLAEINAAFEDRDTWAEPGSRTSAYRTPASLFFEYMNWALISLYVEDRADPQDHAAMVETVEEVMEKNRGFPQFRPFNQHLLKLYRERPAGATIADLYPDIIRWSAEHQASMRSAAIGN